MHLRLLSLSFFIVFSSLNVHAQSSADSLLIVNQKWNNKKLAKGLVWKQASFSGLFQSKQEVNIIEVDLKNKHLQVDLAGLSGGLIKTSELANQGEAAAAINGSFFDMSNGGSTTFIRKENEVINQSTMNKNGKINERANAAVLFDEAKV